jgi:hypothetical protein
MQLLQRSNRANLDDAVTNHENSDTEEQDADNPAQIVSDSCSTPSVSELMSEPQLREVGSTCDDLVCDDPGNSHACCSSMPTNFSEQHHPATAVPDSIHMSKYGSQVSLNCLAIFDSIACAVDF